MGIGTGVRIFAAIAVLAMLGLFLHYVRESGYNAATVEWQARENKRAAEAAKKTAELQDKYRAAERKGAEEIAKAGEAANKEKDRVQAKHDRFIDDVVAGRIRVFVNPVSTGGGGSAATTASASVSGQAGAGACELPRTTVADLGNLARDADQVAVSLNECRAILRAERQGWRIE